MKYIHNIQFFRSISIALTCAGLIFVFFVEKSYASADYIDELMPYKILSEINDARISHGLKPLEINARLQIAAEDKALDMVGRSYFAHNDPDGTAPWKWLDASGYQYSHAGENLAIGFTEEGAQHTAWMESDFHRRNILNTNYAETGIAVVQGRIRGSQELVVVQFFGQSSLPRLVPQDKVIRGIDAMIPQPLRINAMEGVASFSKVVTTGTLHKFLASMKNITISISVADIQRALFLSLLAIQTSVAFTIALQIYLRGYRHKGILILR